MIQNEKIKYLENLARQIRVDIIRTGFMSGKNGAHFGGCLSMAEILAVLYDAFVSYNTNDLEHRDRVILSKGHAALALYCSLYEKGLLSREQLDSFENNGSYLAAHSKRDLMTGQEFSGGSLSLGLSYAVGVAHACKRKGLTNQVYAIVGDGELDEGLIWEALMFAGHNCLDNLTIIVDHNHLQADGFVEEVLDTAPLIDKLKSFGLDVQQISGHSVADIYDALDKPKNGHPKAIIAETIKGKGISFIENKAKWHHGSLSEERYKRAMSELGEEL